MLYYISRLVFHQLTYEGTVDINSIQDPLSRRAIEIQVNEYGQTPKQLFNKPHPKKFCSKQTEIKNNSVNEDRRFDIKEDVSEHIKSISNAIIANNIHSNYPDSIKKRDSLEKSNQDELDLDKLDISQKEASFNFDRTYSCIPRFMKK
jgi:hypothetical protein